MSDKTTPACWPWQHSPTELYFNKIKTWNTYEHITMPRMVHFNKDK